MRFVIFRTAAPVKAKGNRFACLYHAVVSRIFHHVVVFFTGLYICIPGLCNFPVKIKLQHPVLNCSITVVCDGNCRGKSAPPVIFHLIADRIISFTYQNRLSRQLIFFRKTREIFLSAETKLHTLTSCNILIPPGIFYHIIIFFVTADFCVPDIGNFAAVIHSKTPVFNAGICCIFNFYTGIVSPLPVSRKGKNHPEILSLINIFHRYAVPARLCFFTS